MIRRLAAAFVVAGIACTLTAPAAHADTTVCAWVNTYELRNYSNVPKVCVPLPFASNS